MNRVHFNQPSRAERLKQDSEQKIIMTSENVTKLNSEDDDKSPDLIEETKSGGQ